MSNMRKKRMKCAFENAKAQLGTRYWIWLCAFFMRFCAFFGIFMCLFFRKKAQKRMSSPKSIQRKSLLTALFVFEKRKKAQKRMSF